MSFDRIWILTFAWLPIAWAVWEWRRTSRQSALAVKAVTLTLILIALAGPRLAISETKVAVAVLVDTSASASAQDLDKASETARAIVGSQGRNWSRVIPFARNTRALDTSENQKPLKVKATAGEAGRATDLEAAVREAIASLPNGLVPRIALVSDGKENQGSVARAAWQAHELGVPIDTFPMSGRSQPLLKIDAISAPTVASAGERFPIDVVVDTPKAQQVEVELSAEGRVIGKAQAQLQTGANPIRMHAAVNTPGALDLSIAVRAGSDEVRADQAILLRRPKVLYITQDPPDLDNHLTGVLTAAQFDITRVQDFQASTLGEYQLVVFNNVDMEALAAGRKSAIENYVKRGGGLLLLAGEKNIYQEGKTAEDALDRTLPAKLAPPRSPEGTAVVLIIDKSSSMEGRKMEMARLAATGVVENLRPIDMIGVLSFDNSFEWAVTLRKNEQPAQIKRMIAGIMPDGGTQIAPALAEGYKHLAPLNSPYRHMVLLTDGISEEGDSMDLAKEANAKHVTISTVGLGQDVNRSYLERIALNAGGKAYFLTEPNGLQQILLKDVQEHTGSTAVEKNLKAEISKQTEILQGIPIDTAPELKGYVRFTPKPSADTILKIDRQEPLLARWQYGLGRAAVWASDAKPRWASDWITWKGYDAFWTNLARDLLPRAESGEATLTYDSTSGDLVADYKLGPEIEEPAAPPEIFAFGPDGFQAPLPIKKVAAGTYRGRVSSGGKQGLFRARPVADSRAFPEIGLYRPEAELNDYGSNEALLKQVAEYTGGRYQPDPRSVFTAGSKSIPSSMQLWPGLLALAILLSLTELVMRKWKGIMTRS